MESLLDYLEALEDLLENSKPAPFSNKVSIDRAQIFELLSEIRMNLPIEMRQAQRIIEEHDKILDDARNKAGHIIKEGEAHARDLADEHEVYRMAMEEARVLMDDTKRRVRDMRQAAIAYTDEVLEKAEDTLRGCMTNITRQFSLVEDDFSRTISELHNNRLELRESQQPSE